MLIYMAILAVFRVIYISMCTFTQAYIYVLKIHIQRAHQLISRKGKTMNCLRLKRYIEVGAFIFQKHILKAL